jgi:6-pyruvoyltetrahydropterin/6-carboxytetrahydropterin synthase
LHVTVTGEPDEETGMIIDFKQLKVIVEEEVIKRFDHALVLRKGTTNTEGLNGFNIFYLDKEPTAENMLQFISTQLINRLPQHVMLHSLRLYETTSSYAEWIRG